MKKIILLINKNEISKHYNLDEVTDVKNFALEHEMDYQESDDEKLIAKILQVRVEKSSSIEARQYENAAALRDQEWSLVLDHFGCGNEFGRSSSADVGEAMVYLTYNKINQPDSLK